MNNPYFIPFDELPPVESVARNYFSNHCAVTHSKCLDFNFYKRRAEKIGTGKPYYFALNGYWHSIELGNKGSAPLLTMHLSRIEP